MGKARLLILATLIVLGALATAICNSRRAPEPFFEGKPLHYYLQAYASTSTVPQKNAPTKDLADHAIYQMGTNAIPALIDLLLERQWPFERQFFASLQKMHLRATPFTRTARRNLQAMEGFRTLSHKARSATPRLVEVYDRSADRRSRLKILFVLGAMGRAGRDAVPLLLREATNQDDLIRANAVSSLGAMYPSISSPGSFDPTPRPALIVPALTRCLSDPSPMVRGSAAYSLARIGSDAQPAIPALLTLLRSEQATNLLASARAGPRYVGFTQLWAWELALGLTNTPPPPGSAFSSTAAAQAIWEIDPAAAAKAPLKVQ